MIKPIFFMASLLLCSSCSMGLKPLQQHLNEPERSILRTCAELFVETEQTIAAAGAVDSQTARIDGFPYLRIDRFLSSFRQEVSGKAFENWVDRLQELAMDGWRVELMNLLARERLKLRHLAGSIHSENPELTDTLRSCGTLLRKIDLDEATEQEALREKATVPAEYQTWQRIAGIYPLTGLAFRLGIKRWHDQTLKTYETPLEQLPVTGRLVRFGPPPLKNPLNAAEVAGIIKRSSQNPLAIPSPDLDEQRRLFEHFAPVFEIDVASPNDPIGVPVLQEDHSAAIDTSKPTVFRHLSHARIGHRMVLQLNYMIWFPARPLSSAWDLLGGQLDGIIWRVTLLPDGKPWMFDSIHLCGCYHLFFPARHTVIKGKTTLWSEPDFMPQPAPELNENERAVIRIASASHYIDRVYSAPAFSRHGNLYQWDDADSLRSLPLSDGQRRSLYGPDGLVAGSERNERFLFWPMGIPSPGAMRQWGHHATAFVGRRHFDDPRLFERSFDVRPANGSVNQWKMEAPIDGARISR